jgi:hypothetical protein
VALWHLLCSQKLFRPAWNKHGHFAQGHERDDAIFTVERSEFMDPSTTYKDAEAA